MMVKRSRALIVGGISGLFRGRRFGAADRRFSGLDWQLFALDVLSASPSFSRRFAATASQVRPARAFVADLLGDEHPRRDDAVLLTSELAGNMIRHAIQREFLVSLAFATGGVLVAVRDCGSSRIPYPRQAEEEAPSGRGLALVDTLAARRGFHRSPGSTSVWFQLATPPPGLGEDG
ncbi:ATP-binding protein [Streptosporangium sp. NPDC049644]|uniref:ATP-binding protein n=1 Tax=Streptosporangium sp. NPDC049644 TaxID=3155507 RepID=UPI0034120F1D